MEYKTLVKDGLLMTHNSLQEKVSFLEEELTLHESALNRPATHKSLYFERICNAKILHDSPCLGVCSYRHRSTTIKGPFEESPERMRDTDEWTQNIFSRDYTIETDTSFTPLYLYVFNLTSTDRGATRNAILATQMIINECLPVLERAARKSIKGTMIDNHGVYQTDVTRNLLFENGIVSIRHAQDIYNHPWIDRSDTIFSAILFGTKEGVLEMNRHLSLDPWQSVPSYEREDNDTTAEYLILSSDLIDMDWLNLLTTDKVIT